jgi:peptidoglycan/LPS O-acetylase OafA/YrhL
VRHLAPGALLALTLLVVLAHRSDVDRTSLVRVAGTALTLVLLIGVVVTPRSAVGLALASAPMRWLGQRSYSIYLWNVLARITVLYVLGHSALGDLAWVVLVVVLAETGYQLVERPLRARFAGRSVVPRHPLPQASVASVPRLS